jgi:aminocarboxymuconate-semialdehyde decarboxylase
VRPDLCQVKTKTNPREYLGRFYVDSITHEPQALRTNIEYYGLSKVALGSDYPFPLGESHPGKMIEAMDFSMSEKQQLYSGTALEWLGLAREDFI